MPDASRGYETLAADHERRRSSTIGVDVTLAWAHDLPSGARVLELACGTGAPISLALVSTGINLFGLDASWAMTQRFQQRLPGVPVTCATAEQVPLAGGAFDGVLAWGLLFLLDEAAQRSVITEAARVLRPGGHFFFTAPETVLDWRDALTGLPSLGLGREAYAAIMTAAGLTLTGETNDDGDNHYYFATKAS